MRYRHHQHDGGEIGESREKEMRVMHAMASKNAAGLSSKTCRNLGGLFQARQHLLFVKSRTATGDGVVGTW